jgi:hypothetical protein
MANENTGKSSLTSSMLPVGHGAIAARLPEMAGVGSLMRIVKAAATLSILTNCLAHFST